MGFKRSRGQRSYQLVRSSMKAAANGTAAWGLYASSSALIRRTMPEQAACRQHTPTGRVALSVARVDERIVESGRIDGEGPRRRTE